MFNNLNKCILVFLLINSLSDVYSQTLPIPKKSWSELVTLLEPYALTSDELKLTECPVDFDETPSMEQVSKFQTIALTQYLWTEHKFSDGRICVEMSSPIVQSLSKEKARILLSAKKGIGFEESGITEEYKNYNDFVQQTEYNCDTYDNPLIEFQVPENERTSETVKIIDHCGNTIFVNQNK